MPRWLFTDRDREKMLRSGNGKRDRKIPFRSRTRYCQSLSQSLCIVLVAARSQPPAPRAPPRNPWSTPTLAALRRRPAVARCPGLRRVRQALAALVVARPPVHRALRGGTPSATGCAASARGAGALSRHLRRDPHPSAPDSVEGRADPPPGGPASGGPELLRRRILLWIQEGKTSRGRRRKPEGRRRRVCTRTSPPTRPSAAASPSWRRRVVPLDPRASEVGEGRRRQDPAAGVVAQFSERAAVGASGGGEIRQSHPRRAPLRAAVGASGGGEIRQSHPRRARAPLHAPDGVLPNSGWTLARRMMDHREVFLVGTMLPTRQPCTRTCMASMGTRCLHMVPPKDSSNFKAMSH
ncbi:unnamed protein product [Urochloa humidicola]